MSRKMQKLLCKIAVVVTSILLGIAIVTSVIMLENKTAINNFFNTTDVDTITPVDDKTDKEYFKSSFSNIKDLRAAGKEAAEEIEAEGAVLLENKGNKLPIATSNTKKAKISLFSISSIDPAYGGKGSAQSGVAGDQVTPAEGFKNAGFEVNQDLLNFYTNNRSKYARSGRGESAKINDAPWADIVAAVPQSKIAEYGDAAFFIITRTGGEGSDASYTGTDGDGGNYLRLSANEKNVLEELSKLRKANQIKHLGILLNVANSIECKSFLTSDIEADSVLWIGSVGITGFNAVGDIISGKVNPSGHLSDTFWYDHQKNPVYYNFGDCTYSEYENFGMPMLNGGAHPKYGKYVVYQEGIYVGYRYTETRYYDQKVNGNDDEFKYDEVVSYPFGSGLSYTTFEHELLDITDNQDGTYTAQVKVTNKSDVAGKDVVQLYVQKPYDKLKEGGRDKIQAPVLELVGFAKTNLLEQAGQPGDNQMLEITVDKSSFTTYDSEVDKTYIIANGDYRLVEGEDVHDAVNNLLASEGKTGDAAGDASKVKSFPLDYDKTTYATSNGKQVTNLFDDGDVNKYFDSSDNKVTYLSRSDWAATFPAGNTKLKMTQKLASAIMAQDNPSELVEKDDIKYPTYGKIEGERIRLIDLLVDKDGNKLEPISYDDPRWDKFLDQLTWDETVELLNTGLRSTAALPSVLKPATVEHNGPLGVTSKYNVNPQGLATRTGAPDSDAVPPYYPCIGILSATYNVELADKFGDMMGEDAIWAGYGGLYGIGLNVHRSPYGGRAYEYYSEDPFLSGIMATYEVKALQSHGCNAYIKHFALNDQETNRSGLGVWLNEQTLREIYLKPFYMAVTQGNAMNAMIAFNRIGATHCPADKALLTDFLKGEAGMKGFAVTDMYSIGYTSKQMPIFMAAGCDLPDGEIGKANPYQAYRHGYGELAQNMRDAAKRIMYATVKSNSMNGISTKTVIVSVTPTWRVVLTVVDCLFGVLFAASAAWATVIILQDKGVIKTKRGNSNKNENQGD